MLSIAAQVSAEVPRTDVVRDGEYLLSGSDVPDLDRATYVVFGRGQGMAARYKSDSHGRRGNPAQLAHDPSRPVVPDSYDIVFAGGYKQLAVGAERQTGNPAAMSSQGLFLKSAGEI